MARTGRDFDVAFIACPVEQLKFGSYNFFLSVKVKVKGFATLHYFIDEMTSEQQLSQCVLQRRSF